MKFLKKIFSLNARLDRKGYLLLSVLTLLGFIFLSYIFYLFKSDSITQFNILKTVFILVLMFTLMNTVKRGRDSGLSSITTLFLFLVVPIIVMILAIQVEIEVLSYFAFSFVVYLLLMPSSAKELKAMEKTEYSLIIIFIVFVFPLFIFSISPQCLCAGDKAKRDLTCVYLATTARTLDKFKLDNGVYPSTEEGLELLVSSSDIKNVYFHQFPKDAWGKKIVYVKTKDGFELISYGADKKEGGEDEYADIFYSECGK